MNCDIFVFNSDNKDEHEVKTNVKFMFWQLKVYTDTDTSTRQRIILIQIQIQVSVPIPIPGIGGTLPPHIFFYEYSRAGLKYYWIRNDNLIFSPSLFRFFSKHEMNIAQSINNPKLSVGGNMSH